MIRNLGGSNRVTSIKSLNQNNKPNINGNDGSTSFIFFSQEQDNLINEQYNEITRSNKTRKSIQEQYNEITRSAVKEFAKRRDNGWNNGGYIQSGKDKLSEKIEKALNDNSNEYQKAAAQELVSTAARLRYLFSLHSEANNGEISVCFKKLGDLCEKLGIEIDGMLKFIKNQNSLWGASVPSHLRKILWNNFGYLDKDVQDWLKSEYAFESGWYVNDAKSQQEEKERDELEKKKSENHYNEFIKAKSTTQGENPIREQNETKAFSSKSNEPIETKDYLERSLFYSGYTEYFDHLFSEINSAKNQGTYNQLVTDFLNEYIMHHRGAFNARKKPASIDLEFIMNNKFYKKAPQELQDRVRIVNIDPLSDGINLDIMTGQILR